MLGAVMQNPLRETRVTCEVCTGPVEGYRRCYRCNRDAARSDIRVASRVVPLTYACVGRQADNDMYRYKDQMPPQQRRGNLSYQRLLVLVAGFVAGHAECVDSVATLPATRMATVPSLSGRTGPHPLTDLARFLPNRWKRVDLVPKAHVSRMERRETRPDHFSVADPREVAGRHIVVFDDTWVQGGHAQSAAATLLCAGAADITIVVLARRIDPSYHADRLRPALTRMFAPREYTLEICPITGGNCPAI